MIYFIELHRRQLSKSASWPFYSEVAPHKECHVFFGPYKAALASKTQVFPASNCTALEPFLIKVQRLIISNYLFQFEASGILKLLVLLRSIELPSYHGSLSLPSLGSKTIQAETHPQKTYQKIPHNDCKTHAISSNSPAQVDR